MTEDMECNICYTQNQIYLMLLVFLESLKGRGETELNFGSTNICFPYLAEYPLNRYFANGTVIATVHWESCWFKAPQQRCYFLCHVYTAMHWAINHHGWNSTPFCLCVDEGAGRVQVCAAMMLHCAMLWTYKCTTVQYANSSVDI